MTTREDGGKLRPMDKPQSEEAKERLAAALRANLKRRKVQERARDEPDSNPKSDKDPMP